MAQRNAVTASLKHYITALLSAVTAVENLLPTKKKKKVCATWLVIQASNSENAFLMYRSGCFYNQVGVEVCAKKKACISVIEF